MNMATSVYESVKNLLVGLKGFMSTLSVSIDSLCSKLQMGVAAPAILPKFTPKL